MTLTGDKRLNKKLAKLAGKDARKVIRKAVRPALKVVQKQAKKEAPRDTGALRRAIRVRAIKRSRTRVGASVVLGAPFFTGDTFYGSFLEFGTNRIKARGFMKAAAEKKKRQALAIYKRGIRNGIIGLAKQGGTGGGVPASPPKDKGPRARDEKGRFI